MLAPVLLQLADAEALASVLLAGTALTLGGAWVCWHNLPMDRPVL